MTASNKVIKANFISEEWMNLQQAFAKKQYKQQLKCKENTKHFTENTKNFFELEYKGNYKKEIEKWITSFNPIEVMKIICTESKWFSSIIIEMYKLIKENPLYKFKFKEEDDNIFNRIKEQTSSYNNILLKFPLDNSMIGDYFHWELFASVNQEINKKIRKKIKVFDLHEYYDAITLADELVTDMEFLKIFELISNGKSFSSVCVVCEDTQKSFYWKYPDWFDIKQYHSIEEFFVAFVERNICIKFLMSLDNLKSNNNNTTFSLINDQKINQFFDNRITLTSFVISEYQSNRNKFFSDVDLDKLYQEVKSMEDLIMKTNISFSKNPQKGQNSEFPTYKKENDIITIKNLYFQLPLEEFINELIFSDIDKTSSEYLFKRKIYDNIHKLYTNKNAMDLINEDMNKSSLQKKPNQKNRTLRKKKYEKEKSKVKEMQIDSYIKENRNLSEPHKNKSNEIIEECKLNNTQLDTSVMTNFERKYINDINRNTNLNISNDLNILTANSNVCDNNLILSNFGNELLKFDFCDNLDDKEFSALEVSEIKAYFGQDRLKSNNESELVNNKIQNDMKPLINKYLLNDKMISKEMLNKKTTLANNLELSKLKSNNESHNKLIFQISKPLPNTKTNIQTMSPHIFKNNNIIRNLCPYKDENIENGNSNFSNPLYSQFNTLIGEEFTNYSETNETDAASTCISDNQSIKFNFFRRHLFNTPSSDKAIRNKIINSGNDEDRKSVPTKKSNTNDLKEENLKIFHEKKYNLQEFRRISGNANVINQVIIPEEHSVSRNSNNESSENKLIKEQRKNEINNNNEINENDEIGIKKQKKKRHQKFKKNKTQINLNKFKNSNVELKKNNSESFCKEILKSPEKKEDVHSDSERKFNKLKQNNVTKEILNVSNLNENNNRNNVISSISGFSKDNIGKKLNKSQSQNFFINTRSNNFVNNNFFRANDNKQITHQWSGNNILQVVDPFTTIESKSKSNSSQFPYCNNPFICNLNNQYNYMLFNNPNINSNANNIHKDFSIFYNKFSNDIKKFSLKIDEFNHNLKQVKEFCINFIQNLLQVELKSDISLYIYGSFATDLSIESSDIDITIKIIDMSKMKNNDNLLINISKILSDSKLFDNVNPICSASVPIIKIKIDALKILKQSKNEEKLYDNLVEFMRSDMFNNYKYDEEDLTKIKIDLNLCDMCNNTKENVKWVKDQLKTMPEIKPLIHVLKRYLQNIKLNSSFDGGLSSFSLLLMVIAFLKSCKNQNYSIGIYLFKFFEFYGKCYDFTNSIIDINQINPFIKYPNVLECFPVIIDPCSKNNVGKNSFRIQEIKEAFSKAFDKLYLIKIFYDNESGEINIINELLLNKN